MPTVTDRPLRLGLIQCGYVHPEVAATTGDYPELFAHLLRHHPVELTTYVAEQGVLPASTAEQDGWLISGSANSAYEPLPWIGELEGFLRAVIDDGAPMVAICFGHQVLAQALGGRVAKSGEGWGVGLHTYELVGEVAPWMVPPPPDGRHVRMLASHQDQVVELPDGATLLARTDHCPIAAYTVGTTALAIQPHPEFTPAVSQGLLDRRRAVIGEATSDAAEASLATPPDQDLVADWMVAFLRRAGAGAHSLGG